MRGTVQPLPDGGYAYASDVYRVAVDADGALRSLTLGGVEFLHPEHGAALTRDGAPLSLPLAAVYTTEAQSADGESAVFFAPQPDCLELAPATNLGQGAFAWEAVPAAGVTVRHAADARRVQWEGPGGAALRWELPGPPARPEGDRLCVPVPRQERAALCLHLPPSAWRGRGVDVAVRPATLDHCFPAGSPPRAEVAVSARGEEAPAELTLHLRVRHLDTGEVLAAEERRLPLPADGAARLAWSPDWRAPGPWQLEALAAAEGMCLGVGDAVIVNDLPAYRPPLYRPDDFWDFWERARREQQRLPLAPRMQRLEEESGDEYTVYEVHITGRDGRRLKGFWGEPAAPGRYPVSLGGQHPGKNREAPPDRQVCGLKVTMDGQATYRTGYERPETTNLFHCFADMLRWLDFLATCEKADRERCLLYAGSRGGPVAIATLALNPWIRAGIMNVPTNNRWDWQVTWPRAQGWGVWPTDRPDGVSPEAFRRTLGYFDPCHFAERVRQPVLIGLGLRDRLSQVTGNLACAARLGEQARLCLRPEAAHDGPSEEWQAGAQRWRESIYWGEGVIE